MKYVEQKMNTNSFQLLTSLSVVEFEYLFYYFSPEWDKYYKYHTLEGKKRKLPIFKEHKNAVLYGTEQKLFFLLVYLKNNPLQTFQGSSFGVSQSKVSKIYRILLSVLDQTLKRMQLSPCRDGELLKELLKGHQSQVYWYDGTERPIQRNADIEAQEEDFSGKKHAHRTKNLVLNDAFQTVLYLSPSEHGSVHEKKWQTNIP